MVTLTTNIHRTTLLASNNLKGRHTVVKLFNEGAQTRKTGSMVTPLPVPQMQRVQFISADGQKVHLP